MFRFLPGSFLIIGILFIGISGAAAQGIRGIVKSNTGEAMSFATIAAKGTTLGTIANEEGRYELSLKPGQYELVFQFLGFKAESRSVTITDGFQEVNVTMTQQSINLKDVKIGKNTEDPAVSIMRRAIAKARFHQLQVQRFTARVYTKSSVIVHKLPMTFLYQKQLKEAEKEANFKVGRPMLNETVSEVDFRLPNTVKQRVVANRNSQGDFIQVANYYNANLYTPKLMGAASPLAPNAFGYYKFEYEGTFHEQGVDVSKIRVIPRQYGDGVMRGTIYIIEDTWAVYSAQLETRNELGFNILSKIVCSPIKNVWMPVNQQFEINGAFMGATFTAQFVRNQTFRDFTINPGFVDDVKVVDERFNPPANTLSKTDMKNQTFADAVAKQKEFSTKNLKQLVKEYEKQEYKARKQRKEDVTVVRNDSTVIDTLAKKRSNAFWDSLRTVPLTQVEVTSYKIGDSLKVVRTAAPQTDSAKRVQAGRKKSRSGGKHPDRYPGLEPVAGHLHHLDQPAGRGQFQHGRRYYPGCLPALQASARQCKTELPILVGVGAVPDGSKPVCWFWYGWLPAQANVDRPFRRTVCGAAESRQPHQPQSERPDDGVFRAEFHETVSERLPETRRIGPPNRRPPPGWGQSRIRRTHRTGQL